MKLLNKDEIHSIIFDTISRKKDNNIQSMDLENTIIKDVILEKNDYICTIGSNIHFENCFFIESMIINTPFASESWKFENCIFFKCNLAKLWILHSVIKNCELIECYLHEAYFDSAVIEDSTFISCNFSAASFQESIIKNTKFLYPYSLLKSEVFKDSQEDNVLWFYGN